MNKRKGCAVEHRRHINASAYKLVNKGIVVRCLPLSRNSLTVALTSTYKRNSLYCWTMKGIRPSLLL